MESGCLVMGGGRENRMGGNGREDKSKREGKKLQDLLVFCCLSTEMNE